MVWGRDETTWLFESMQLRWAHVMAVWDLLLIDLEWKLATCVAENGMERKRVARASYRADGGGTLLATRTARGRTGVEGHLTEEGIRLRALR